MADLIKKIRTAKGDLQIDYNALANLPTLSYKVDENGVLRVALKKTDINFVNFTIDGTSYTVNRGTTWREAIENGEVPIGEVAYHSDEAPYVCSGSQYMLMTYDGALFGFDEEICENDYYTTGCSETPDTVIAFIGYEWGYHSEVSAPKGTTWGEYVAEYGCPNYCQLITTKEEYNNTYVWDIPWTGESIVIGDNGGGALYSEEIIHGRTFI